VNEARMKIAINGIGIAGPTLAYWARHFGHEPVLFERAPSPRTGGYVIDFWGLGFDIAERMGVLPALLERCYRMQRLSLVDAGGSETAGLDIGAMREGLHGRFISIAREDLAAVLLGACSGIDTRFGVSVVGLEHEPDGVSATLSNGRRERFDFVVGADGLHSKVRELAFGLGGLAEMPLGCHVAAFRMPGYPRRAELTYVSHTEPKRQAGRVTLRDGDTLALLICRSELVDGGPPGETATSCLRRAFRGMAWEVPSMLDRMDDAADLYFDRVSQIHLAQWTTGRVGLVGDAAACASFLAGEGTGLAMIEAYVLAGELHRARGQVAAACAAYEGRLRAFVAAKQKAALRLRGFFAPRTAAAIWARDVALKALAVPLLGTRLVARSLRDDLALPDYVA
jgi:2-polyprenyl-6-methoxyphenol hydroxylase-like FAD-dependent oxidoreductase